MLREFAYFFAAQFLNYAIMTWNMRAVALGWYLSIALTDLVIAGIGFTMIRRVAEAHSPLAIAGYCFGGMCGSLAAMYVTKKWEKKAGNASSNDPPEGPR